MDFTQAQLYYFSVANQMSIAMFWAQWELMDVSRNHLKSANIFLASHTFGVQTCYLILIAIAIREI